MIDVQAAAEAVWALLEGLANVNAYDGEFTRIDEEGNVVPAPPPLDEDGRVHAYAVFYPSSGVPVHTRLGGSPSNLSWSFQVTCAGGDRVRALWCLSQIRRLLTGRRISVAGREGQIREVGDPGPLRRDDDVSPVRFWLPLDFGLYL